jgi:hypothetical protein
MKEGFEVSDDVSVSVAVEVSDVPVRGPASPAVVAPQAAPKRGARFLGWPVTRPGWWSFGLETAFVFGFVVMAALRSPSLQTLLWGSLAAVNRAMLVALPLALVMALVGGLMAISALARRRERSILVWFAATVFIATAAVVALSVL